MWGCGRSPHPHIYPSPLLEGSFFSVLFNRYWVNLATKAETINANIAFVVFMTVGAVEGLIS